MPHVTATATDLRTAPGHHGAPPGPDEAIEVVRRLLDDASFGSSGDVWVPGDVLRVVLSLVEGGEWDEFDGHRRWAGPWRRSPR